MKAIILAAGKGTRLSPMTLIKPKPLLKVNGKTILENTINILNKHGINDIVIVTGYKHELFDPYQKKLGFKKVVYDGYDNRNSSASLKFVIDEIEKGTIILNGDMYLKPNCLDHIRSDTSQFLAQKIVNDVVSWGYIVDRNCRVLDIDINATSGYGDGIAIFDNEEDLVVLKKEELLKCTDDEYWEYCVFRSINKINFYAFNYDDLYTEIDSFKDALYHNLLTPKDIAEQCSDDGNIEKLAGITNINYKIKFLNENKVIRIPGKGTENIINRKLEKEILALICNKNIAPKCEFYDSDIKLSDFLEGYRSLNFYDIKNNDDAIFNLIVQQMKKLHEIEHDNHKNFEPIYMVKEIKNYERLSNINITTKIEHKFMLELAREMDNGKLVLCHRDLQLPNIMYNGNDIKLIDFEYAGFSSVIWELGNFTAELELTEEQINKFIKIYGNITYREIIIGQLMSNYIWGLWGWIYDSVDLSRNYISRFHSNIKFLMNK